MPPPRLRWRDRRRRRPPPPGRGPSDPGPGPPGPPGPGMGYGPSPPPPCGFSETFTGGCIAPFDSGWPENDAPGRRLRLRRLRGCWLSGVIKLQNPGCSCHLRVAGIRRSGRRSCLSKRPAGCLWSPHGGAGV